MPTAICQPREAPGGRSTPPQVAAGGGRLFANVTQLVGSHVVVGLVGLAALPLLARNFGPAGYGGFSLFVALLGVLSSLDFSRPLLVRELSSINTQAERSELLGLTTTSALLFGPAAFMIGFVTLGPWIGIGLGLGVATFILASAPYASLAAMGRVGHAGTVRNSYWALAIVSVAGLSFFVAPPHSYTWPFAAANVAILFTLRRLAPNAPLIPRPQLAALRARSHAARDLVGFGLAAAVVVSADRLLLEHYASAEAFGRYGAQYDLATKVNIISTALGAALYPMLSRAVHEKGKEQAARDFVRFSTRIVVLYFLGILVLLATRQPIQHLILGDAFGACDLYPVILAGTFVHLLGFLIAPWQRACNDFRGQRRAYAIGATLMIIAGVILIPRYGAQGAAWTYLVARTSELVLIAQAARDFEPSILPRKRLFGLAVLMATLFAFAFFGVGS